MWNIDKRLMAFFAVLLVISFAAGVKYNDMKNKTKINEEMLLTASAEGQNSENDIVSQDDVKRKNIKVYVCGQVKKPGVYELQEGCRLYEVIEMAGGTLEEAELRVLNMARILQDEETIVVSAEGEVTMENNDLTNLNSASCAKSDKVNINTASIEEIDDKLTGIGPALAQRIIEYRSIQGNFKQIEDIKNVSGIGDKKFDDIKDNICVR